MKKTELKTQAIRQVLAKKIGETTVTTYFSYIGIFKDNAMIALYKNECLYLYLAPQDLDKIKDYPGVVQLEDKRIHSAFHYFFIPEALFDDPIFSEWLINSVETVKLNRKVNYYEQKDKLRHLPNFSFSSECMLKRIQIYTVEDLVARGVIQTFVDLVKHNETVNHITLFKIYGAIHSQFIYTIPLKIKLELLDEVNKACTEIGLRPMFNIKP